MTDNRYVLPKYGVVHLIDEIDSESASGVIMGLYEAYHAVPERDGEYHIQLLISTDGGGLQDSLAIADAVYDLQGHRGVVTGLVLGRCCSGGITVLQACSRRLAMPQAWLGVHGLVDSPSGDARVLAAEMAYNERLIEQQLDLLVTRTRMGADYWAPFLRDQIVQRFSAAEAAEVGLIDAVV